MLIDSHCHFSLIDQNKRSSIFHDMQEAGIGAFIEVGCDHERNLEALKIGTTFPHARIVLGYHPTDIQKSGDEVRIASMNTLAKQIQDNRSMIVGIGETGLDYHSLSPDNQEQEKNEQKKWFLAQGELAKQFQLPLVIHSRDADQDMMELLATIQPEKFVLHCYSSTPEFAHSILAKHPGAYF
jgi:TatD DNase family protein